MLCLADAHCHLDAAYFDEGPDAVMLRARAAGVVGLVVVGLAAEAEAEGSDGLEPARFAVDFARRSPGDVTACVGLHPHDASRWTSALHEGLRELAARPRSQRSARLASTTTTTGRPETRSATPSRASWAWLASSASPSSSTRARPPRRRCRSSRREGARDVGGIIHCFSEDRAFAERALALGFDLSFSGIVTFKGARSVREVAAWAPIDRILVETDSPYLAPVPLRGKRCEPAHVVHTARCVAELRGVSVEVVAAATLANTERRFARAFARPRPS